MTFRSASACLVVALLYDLLVYPATPPASKSQNFLDNAKVVTITNLDVLAEDAFRADRANGSVAIDSILYKSKGDEPRLNISREQFYKTMREQKDLNDGMQTRLGVFNTGKKFVGAFADLGGPVGIFAFTAGDTYLDHFNEKLRSEMEDSRRDLSKQFFAGRTIDPERLRTARALGHAAFAKEVEHQAGLPDAFGDLPPEQREPAIVRLGEFTLATVALQGQEFATANNATKAEFNRLRNRIGNIETCQHQLATGIQHLMTETETNTAQLAKVTKELDDNHQDLGLMQKVMFGHLTVDEQLDLVKNSRTLQLTDDERKSMVENLTKRKVLLDDARKWNEFVHTGNDLIGIADKLGVDKDIVQNLQKGLAAGDTAYSAINAALSGNYLGAINAVLGIFGGGGMDAETAHYTAIMAKLDEIVETQKKIIAVQQAILKELGQIETLIIQNQLELRGTLASIFALQANTLNAVIQIKETDLNNCTKFLNDRYVNEKFMSDAGRFADYASMQEYFVNNWQLYDGCRHALDESIATISGPHGIFFGYPYLENEAAKTNDTSLVQVLEPIHDAVAPFFAYLNRFVPDSDAAKRTVKGSFFAPSVDFDTLVQKEKLLGLNSSPLDGSEPGKDSAKAQQHTLSPEATKLQTLRPISAVTYPEDNPAVNMFYTNFTKELLSPDAIVEYANVELQINSYRELISDSGTTLLDSKELYRGRGQKRKSSEIALKAAFDWLTLAIAQQTFLGGDMLLPFLSIDGFGEYKAPEITLNQLVEEPKSKEIVHDQQLALAHYLLGHNPVLLQNVIRYRIFKLSGARTDKRVTAFGYAWAYSHSETPLYLRTLLKDTLPVEYVEKGDNHPDVPASGWYSKYVFTDYTKAVREERAVMVPVPPIEDVLERAFVISTPLRKLLECRNSINALLSADQLLEQASGKQNEFRDLKLMLLMQHYQPPPEDYRRPQPVRRGR
jgi:hypothetical protein